MLNIADIHQRIYDDPEWRTWNDMIDASNAESSGKNNWSSASHAFDVANIATNSMHDIGGTMHEIFLVDIAALLHDCGRICGNDNHAKASARIAYAFLHARWGKYGGSYILRRDSNNPTEAIRVNGPLSNEDIDLICHAIAVHSDGIGCQNSIDAILCLANSKHCIEQATDDVPLDLQAKINRIEYRVIKDALYVDYIADEDFNIKEFIRRYPKALHVPQRAAIALHKTALLQLNGYAIR